MTRASLWSSVNFCSSISSSRRSSSSVRNSPEHASDAPYGRTAATDPCDLFVRQTVCGVSWDPRTLARDHLFLP